MPKKRVYTCAPDDSLETALDIMGESRVRRLPVLGDKGNLAPQPPHALHKFLITRMSVGHDCQRTHVPRESLREEKIPRHTIDVRHRCVRQRVERVETIEPGDDPPCCSFWGLGRDQESVDWIEDKSRKASWRFAVYAPSTVRGRLQAKVTTSANELGRGGQVLHIL